MEAEHRGVVARGWGNRECLLMGWLEMVRTFWNSMVVMVIQLCETLNATELCALKRRILWYVNYIDKITP